MSLPPLFEFGLEHDLASHELAHHPQIDNAHGDRDGAAVAEALVLAPQRGLEVAPLGAVRRRDDDVGREVGARQHELQREERSGEERRGEDTTEPNLVYSHQTW